MATNTNTIPSFDQLVFLPEDLESELVRERKEAFSTLTGKKLIKEIGKINSKYRAMNADVNYGKKVSEDETLEQYVARIYKPKCTLKLKRELEVKSIKVTTSKGYELDGDEASQSRLLRMVIAFDDDHNTTWINANNVGVDLTVGDLREALGLAVEKQTEIYLRVHNEINAKESE